MRNSLFVIAIVTLAYGLWVHDWTTIIAGFVLAIVWPMIQEDVHERRRERLLDSLWDDDGDLSDSA